MINIDIHEAITLYLLNKDVRYLSQTKWNKLMFLIDGAYVCLNDKQLTTFEYIKLPYGPVPDNYSKIINKMYYNDIINKNTEQNLFDSKIILEKNDHFSVNMDLANNVIDNYESLKYNVKTILDSVVKLFHDWTASDLSDFSHELDAWKLPEMYTPIDLNTLKSDTFLNSEYGNPNLGKLVIEG
ncbi:MAG: Panacea domain-containing protein [Leptospirales bacterium]